MSQAIGKALGRMHGHSGGAFLAIRSSAEEEDREHSFAGQFKTVLNVPLEPEAVERAYRKVIASLYSGRPLPTSNRRDMMPGASKWRWAAWSWSMPLQAASSIQPRRTVTSIRLIISAAWGLGEAVVEGRTEADCTSCEKDKEPEW